MLTSTRYQVEYPDPANRALTSADVPRDLAAIIEGLEKSAMYGQGTFANRPTSTAGSPGIQGRFYYTSDTQHLYYDYGTGWLDVTPAPTGIGTGEVGTNELADNAVTNAKMADNSVGATEIINGSVTSAELASALFPSQGAGASAEALRALGTGAANAAAGNDSRLSDQRTPSDGSVTAAKLATNLRSLVGHVNSNGTIAAGTGFTVVRNGTGDYTINFTVPFGAAPIVLVTPGTTGVQATATIDTVGASSCRVKIANNSGAYGGTIGPSDAEFYFKAESVR